MASLIKSSYGVVLCIIIGIAALLLSVYIHLGAITISILLGIVIGNIFKPGKRFEKGIAISEKHILSIAIALMGVNLDFFILKELGYRFILIIIAALLVTIFSSITLSGIFKFDRKFALLLGIGNGICGSSAIAATKEIIGVNEEKAGLSITVVNFLGTIGIFLLPLIDIVILKFTDINSGVLIGNTLQAVGHVVAAGFSVNELAGQTAIIVKMTRVLMLTPVVIILIFVFLRKKPEQDCGDGGKISNVPIFIIGFILFSFIPTFGLLPENYIRIISLISKYALIIAMAGIGLRITFITIVRDGKSALLIGGIVFIIQIVFTGSMIYMFL
ncbi:MAG: putative sulfate exporter family transporter [Candidatus Aminicenantes bacterium]|nr:putative sulfate exporter family transporter [Candidatus Aminicenantes bacterium]